MFFCVNDVLLHTVCRNHFCFFVSWLQEVVNYMSYYLCVVITILTVFNLFIQYCSLKGQITQITKKENYNKHIFDYSIYIIYSMCVWRFIVGENRDVSNDKDHHLHLARSAATQPIEKVNKQEDRRFFLSAVFSLLWIIHRPHWDTGVTGNTCWRFSCRHCLMLRCITNKSTFRCLDIWKLAA